MKRDKAEKRFVMGAIGVFLLLTALPSAIHAGIPQAINYQGYLTDAQGVPVKGTVEMVFSIYNVATGGSPLWSEMQSVEVIEGVYNVVLGAKVSFRKSPSLTFDVPYYLGVKVGEDSEMTPRMALTSAGYAFRAQWVDAIPPHDHDASYLNATGDSVTLASSGTVLYVHNTGTGNGIFGGASGLNGRGVNGTAWGDSGSGVYGTAWGVTGSGVYGYGAGNEGNGVYGTTYGQYARGVSGNASGSEGKGVEGVATGASGIGVSGHASNSGNAANYGGHFSASGTYGRGVSGNASGNQGKGVEGNASGTFGVGISGYANNTGDAWNYGGLFIASGTHGRGVFGNATATGADVENYGGYFTASGALSRGVYGNASATGVDVENYGGYFVASGDRGTGVYARGGPNGYAGDFAGNVRIKHRVSGVTLIELGEGLDYAEGFEVSTPGVIGPGSVVIIDSDNPGKLTLSERPYDKRVAGIVAGAKGLGSGVRLGAGQHDCDVALAGRVYCNVDAGYGAVSTGDLLTTSPTPGFAMVVNDYHKAQGAILGKAMENIGLGEKRQILVLVTLQ